MKKLLLLMLCIMPLFVSCSSDDDENNDSESTVTFFELYTGDYEWVASDNSRIIRFLDSTKALYYYRYELCNCYYYFKYDDNENLKFQYLVCGTGDDWEYFAVNEEPLWYDFVWADTSHTSFIMNGLTFTKRTVEAIVEVTD